MGFHAPLTHTQQNNNETYHGYMQCSLIMAGSGVRRGAECLERSYHCVHGSHENSNAIGSSVIWSSRRTLSYIHTQRSATLRAFP